MLYYRRKGYVHVKTEIVPLFVVVPAEPFEVEVRHSISRVYDVPSFELIETKDEAVGEVSMNVGIPELASVGVSGQYGGQSRRVEAALTGELGPAQLEICPGEVMAYGKVPFVVGSKAGAGIESRGVERCIVMACRDVVEKGGGYNTFGKQYLRGEYEFAKVLELGSSTDGQAFLCSTEFKMNERIVVLPPEMDTFRHSPIWKEHP